MSYDPNDCELGICGPCDACMEQEDPRGDFIELGDEIPEVRNVSTCKFGWIGEGDVGMTCTNEARADGYCDSHKPIATIDLTPSWVAVVRIYLEVLTNSDAREQAKSDARSEILRAAKLADLYVKEHKR